MPFFKERSFYFEKRSKETLNNFDGTLLDQST